MAKENRQFAIRRCSHQSKMAERREVAPAQSTKDASGGSKSHGTFLRSSISHTAAIMPLKNSLHRRNHKERSQLAHRQRLGILEKHKDYVLRARDYHSKQDRLKRLAQKAAERNKDEFYYGMNRQRTEVRIRIFSRRYFINIFHIGRSPCA